MNNFSFNRLMLFAKSEMQSNRKNTLLFAGLSLAYFFAVNYFSFLATNFHSDFSGAVVSSWIFIAVTTFITASQSFQKYFHKGYANATLMLPVSQAEKFTFALLYAIVIVPIYLIAGAYIINMLWTMGCGVENQFLYFENIKQTFIASVFSSVSSLSIFFFGAIFFRRNQFAMTLLCLFCIGMGIAYLTYLAVQVIDFNSIGMWLSKFNVTEETILNISIAWNVVLTTVMLSLSWCRFRRLQITK